MENIKVIKISGCNDCVFNDQGFCNHPDLVGNKFDQPLRYNNEQSFCPLNNNGLLIVKKIKHNEISNV